eukprot:GHVR01010660.1.p1 GENE.GHVR01010660.1~~GHVR01010660.1.p1  ORF type:complete len:134 (+),score=14.85 GHVR01010660.1:7-408(+)
MDRGDWSTPIMAMNHGSRGLVHTNNGDESWIEGTEIPVEFRIQINEQLNKVIKIHQLTPLVTGRQLDLLRTSLAMVGMPNVTSEMVSTATSKKWADKQQQNKFWEEKKSTEGGPPSTRGKANQAWQVPNTTGG